MKRFSFTPMIVLLVAACGGESPAPDPASSAPAIEAAAAVSARRVRPSGPMVTPEWFAVDQAARTVHMTVTAGASPDNNYWNFNGHVNGDLLLTVPEGYAITIEFVNADPTMPHSLGISRELENFMVPLIPDAVFPGAITKAPASMTSSTLPGEAETVRFVATTAGSYSMVCYIAGHTAVGMWIYFDVSADGSAGARTM